MILVLVLLVKQNVFARICITILAISSDYMDSDYELR